MPRISDQHGRFGFLRRTQHVTEQPFFSGKRQERHIKRRHTDRRPFAQMHGLFACAVEKRSANADQHQTQNQRRQRFKSGVAVGVIVIGGPDTVPRHKKHQHIRQQVGKRVKAIHQ